MPNYYSPGVYIEEVNTGPRPIEAVATAVAAFVGFAPYSSYDDANQPVLITSWAQYVEKFGLRKDDGRKEPFMKDAYMSHAVYGYFLNGGTRCYVVRVAPPAWKTALKDKQLTAAPQQVLTKQARAARQKLGKPDEPQAGDVVLTLMPKAPLKQDIEVSIDRAAGSQPSDCEIAVRVKMGDTTEEFKRIRLEKLLPEAVIAAQKAQEADAAVTKAEQAAAAADKAKKAAADADDAKKAAADEAKKAAAGTDEAQTAAATQKAHAAAASADEAKAAAAAAENAKKASADEAKTATAAATDAKEALKQAEATAKQAKAATSGQEDQETLAYFNRTGKFVEIKQETTLAEADLAFGVYYLSVPQPDSPATLDQDEIAKRKKDNLLVKQSDIVGDVSERSGVFGLEITDDVTMVCCPDLMSPLNAKMMGAEALPGLIIAVQTAMINHCELAADRIAILDVPREIENPQKVETWRQKTAGYDSMFAALYYPWITITNPLAGADGEPQMIDIPPCGHVAGIYARNDSERGVHKAPANEIVRGALSVTREITRGEQDGLNPNGINCIRTFPGRGIRVWGARTLASDPLWRYVSVRRLFNMVEKSIERDTQWVVFEPNSPDLWSRVRRDVNAFLMTLWRDGMLFGNTPDQAFYVKCDAELNPPESRDLGRLIIEVGLAPVKPAEFVIFRFSQFTAEST